MYGVHWRVRYITTKILTAMNEEQLRWTVFLVVGRLLDTNEREVPNVDPSVARGAGKDSRVVRRPCDVQNLVCVRLEDVQLAVWYS